ncbi:oligosaccharide flippase family protein [Halobellus sp. GM3]|uniref:oligosaccharide flippase family protein n=1 Tax=Halobellus sp. GM3 TaxID=3458410 RepID=UPI00403D6980
MSDRDATELGRSGMIIFFGTGLSMVSGFFFRLILSNVMGPSGFGTIILAISLMNIVAIPTTIGLTEGIAKFYPESTKKQSNAYISFSLTIVTLLSIISMLGIYFNADIVNRLFFNSEVSSEFIFVLAVTVPLFSIIKIIHGSLRGAMESQRFVALAQVTQPYAKLIFSAVAAVTVGSILSVFIGVFLSLVVTVVSGLVLLFHTGWQFKLEFDIDYTNLLRFSAPLMISSSVYILLSRVDRLFLGYYRTPIQVGIYEVALTIALLLTIFRSSFSFLLLPKISKLVSNSNTSDLNYLYGQTTKWILISTTPALLIIATRPYFFIRLFGEDYSVTAVYWPLAILATTHFLDAVTGPNGDSLLGLGKSKTVMLYNLISLVVNLVLNILLIPRYGIIGAAIALFIGYTVMNIAKSYDLFVNHHIFVFNWPGIQSSFGAAIVALPALYFIRELRPTLEFLFLATIWMVSVAAAILLLWSTGNLTQDDKTILYEVSHLFL